MIKLNQCKDHPTTGKTPIKITQHKNRSFLRPQNIRSQTPDCMCMYISSLRQTSYLKNNTFCRLRWWSY